jgi:hypothetical protein
LVSPPAAPSIIRFLIAGSSFLRIREYALATEEHADTNEVMGGRGKKEELSLLYLQNPTIY